MRSARAESGVFDGGADPLPRAGVSAAALNVTVSGANDNGYAVAWSGGTHRPRRTSASAVARPWPVWPPRPFRAGVIRWCTTAPTAQPGSPSTCSVSTSPHRGWVRCAGTVHRWRGRQSRGRRVGDRLPVRTRQRGPRMEHVLHHDDRVRREVRAEWASGRPQVLGLLRHEIDRRPSAVQGIRQPVLGRRRVDQPGRVQRPDGRGPAHRHARSHHHRHRRPSGYCAGRRHQRKSHPRPVPRSPV